jgi:hypothetical protein
MNKSALALILLFVIGCVVVVSGLVTGRTAAPVAAPEPAGIPAPPVLTPAGPPPPPVLREAPRRP